ncbi:MAG TPA: alpha/beta fold hydrolase [Terracidiphilus sp.]|nr:alpha/beta fold hydrolase [Terracidiphilus sp.]
MTITAAIPPHPIRAGSPRLHTVDLRGPEGRLEAVVNEGAADAPFSAVICHPHPLGGGTLHNKVVYYAMKALNAPDWGLRWPVLRFNFRGTGRSEGTHRGNAEAEDILAAVDWLENQYGLPVVVVGFSFGAAMALRAVHSNARGVRAVAALGLPTRAQGREYHYPFLKSLALPKLFLSGDRDQFASPPELEQIVAEAAPPKHRVVLRGADHFFTGQLKPMQDALTGWLKESVV